MFILRRERDSKIVEKNFQYFPLSVIMNKNKEQFWNPKYFIRYITDIYTSPKTGLMQPSASTYQFLQYFKFHTLLQSGGKYSHLGFLFSYFFSHFALSPLSKPPRLIVSPLSSELFFYSDFSRIFLFSNFITNFLFVILFTHLIYNIII